MHRLLERRSAAERPDAPERPSLRAGRGARTRRAAVAGLLAAVLAATPGGSAPTVEGAGPQRQPIAFETGHLVATGRTTVRALARLEVARTVAEAAPRVAWNRRGGSPVAGDAPSIDAGGPGGALEPAALGGPGVVGAAWDGLSDQAVSCGTSRPCVEPADPAVAVSSTHVVQSVSQATRITSRTGGGAVTVTNRAFFGVTAFSPSAVVASPQVVFDPAHERWMASLFAGTCTGGAVFVAVSATADPTGAWDRYHLPFPGRWPTSPRLGLSSTLLGIGVNEMDVACGSGGAWVLGAYRGTRLHVIDRADLEAAPDDLEVASTAPDPAAFALTPAIGLTADDTLHAVLALDDGSTNRADLGYLAIDGTVDAGLQTGAPVNLTTSAGLAKLADPPTPVDAGGLIGIQRNALDLRPAGAAWRDGRLLVGSTGRCTVGSSTRPCARVTELVTSPDEQPSVRQDLRIGPSAGFTDTFVPGVGYSDDGTIWAVYSQAGASQRVSSWARRQLPDDPPGAWSTGTALIAAGRGLYGGTAGAGLNERWGEHVAVARDPLEPASAWQANQLADTGGGWTTRVARLGDDIAPPAVSAPRPVFVKRITASASSVKLDLTWSASDAGSGVAGFVLERSLDGGAWIPIATLGAGARSHRVTASYGRRHAYRVMATDNAGNASAPGAGTAFTPALVSEGSSAVAYRGTWSLGRSSVYLGKKTRYTGTARRRATLSFTGLAVAWVASIGPARGSARVIVDGTGQGTYSTHAGSTRHRHIITGRTFSTRGPHTFRVEAVGTRGHPRVDVDAFIVLR